MFPSHHQNPFLHVSPEVFAGILTKIFFQMLIYNAFLPILTMKRYSMLQSSYSSGNNEDCGKEYKETGFPRMATVKSDIVIGLHKKDGFCQQETSRSLET